MGPLIGAHLAHGRAATAQSSDHTLGVQALNAPDIRFWGLFTGGIAVGCGALKALPDATSEVKSVHIAQSARGRGLARRLMRHLIEIARQEGRTALVLETGSNRAYASARGLYASLGFTNCGPIPGYGPDPNSCFLCLPLDPARLSPQ